MSTRCETCRWSESGYRASRCGEYAPDGWKGFTEEERVKARQIVAMQDFFRRLARVGRT